MSNIKMNVHFNIQLERLWSLENSTAQSPQTSKDEGQQVGFYSKVVFDVFASFLEMV